MRATGGVLMGVGVAWCAGVIALLAYLIFIFGQQHSPGSEPVQPLAAVAASILWSVWFGIPFTLPGIVAFLFGAWAWNSK